MNEVLLLSMALGAHDDRPGKTADPEDPGGSMIKAPTVAGR